jgi:HEPN domain-containing protein
MKNSGMEWLKQAEYDLETAEYLFSGGRYLYYSVFMCHLAIEKALKGLYENIIGDFPPKTHNLLYLLKKIEKVPEENMSQFIVTLNQVSITTRYPDTLEKTQEYFTQERTSNILSQTHEVLKWIKKQL